MGNLLITLLSSAIFTSTEDKSQGHIILLRFFPHPYRTDNHEINKLFIVKLQDLRLPILPFGCARSELGT